MIYKKAQRGATLVHRYETFFQFDNLQHICSALFSTFYSTLLLHGMKIKETQVICPIQNG